MRGRVDFFGDFIMTKQEAKEMIESGKTVFDTARRRSFFKRDDDYIVLTLFTRDYKGRSFQAAWNAWKSGEVVEDGK